MSVAFSAGKPAALRGAVIRAWREDSGVGQHDLARSLNVALSAVSMWESGQRATRSAANVSLVADIAENLGLSSDGCQAFKDMWMAAASVTAVEARADWAHNYQWPSGPGWVWLRCPEPPAVLSVRGWWSDPIQGCLKMEVGAGGVFVQFPKTIPNPPLEVVFDESVGWADFGKGTIPLGVAKRLGAPVLNARTLALPVQPFEPPLQSNVFASLVKAIHGFKSVVDDFGPAWDLIRPHFGIARFDRPPHPITDSAGSHTAEQAGLRIDDSGWILSQALVEPARFRRIREARGLSREAAAAQVTAASQRHPVGTSALRAYEETGSVPATDCFFSRLDTVYGTDGRFGLDVIHGRYDRSEIEFPAYWVGPVWFQVRGPSADATGQVNLVWGPWQRRQHVLSGTILTTRKSTPHMPPLIYEVPPGWQIRAGVGAVSSGLDINHGWYPKDNGAALSLLTRNVKAVVTGN